MTGANACDPELVALLSALVAIPSFSGEEGPVQSWIGNWFRAQGLEAAFEPADGGLFNLVVIVRGREPGPVLWMGGHCDTVGVANGWTRAPHQPVVEDGRLYGLGAMDMKGGLAAAMLAVRDLHRSRGQWCGQVVFAALADEEAYSRGANGFVRHDRRIDAALMCEPHFDDVVIGAMGKINLRIDVAGRSAHASQPEAGVNAATAAARLAVALDGLERASHPAFGRANHCVLSLGSGGGRYEIRVPDQAFLTVNWHLMPGETVAEALSTVRACATSLGSDAQFTLTVGEPRYESFILDREHSFVRLFDESYRATLGKAPDFRFGRGVSDANIFAGRAGIPTLLFGPTGANMHSGDEWVDLDQLHLSRLVLADVARRFLSPEFESQRP